MPSVPANMKQSTEASVWTNPASGIRYYIPKGAKCVSKVPHPNGLFCGKNLTTLDVCSVSLITVLMQRGDSWGPEANVFDPERWIDDRNKKYYLANPFIFLPSTEGRVCSSASRCVIVRLPAIPAFDVSLIHARKTHENDMGSLRSTRRPSS